MQQLRQNITTGIPPKDVLDRKVSLKISPAPQKQQLGDILQNSANDISKKLIDQVPEGIREPLNNVREETMNSIKNFREQRQLNQKPPVNDVTMNQTKKKTGWQKFKGGLSKFWQFARKPIQGLIGMVPGAGSIINSGIDYLSGDRKLALK
ncbi:Hypothetical_protein [Hexamita inflata]|uniref:Hypothetical_protein n=1 Tax=Hexamita inflata TaxID=28002 RepID=A0AA86NAP1_9EUKA|nr:Hypothetical protein HINF_LOCUS3139 [Hexamita inflata]CAI9915506.1 Hypothetical protein HINF_LOCUS3151 [Hexamita inflata]CAI9932269.1 Hypothetical protein HINF_LOCUS19914 [Hexamita inflata]